MAVAHSIFNLDGGGGSIVLGSFWYAHDSVPLKVSLGLEKNWFVGI